MAGYHQGGGHQDYNDSYGPPHGNGQDQYYADDQQYYDHAGNGNNGHYGYDDRGNPQGNAHDGYYDES